MLSTLEPESAYSAFNLNLVSELAPLHIGDEIPKHIVGKAVQVERIRLTLG